MTALPTALLTGLVAAQLACGQAGERPNGAGGEQAAGGESASRPKATLRAPAIGAIAPSLTLSDLDDKPVSLAALHDTVVVMNIWATWCIPCRMETPELVALARRFAGQPVRVIGVSIDGPGAGPEIRDFLKEFAVDYPVWLDPTKDVQAKFLTVGVPETFVLDRQGVIRARQIGGVRRGDTTLVTAVQRALTGS